MRSQLNYRTCSASAEQRALPQQGCYPYGGYSATSLCRQASPRSAGQDEFVSVKIPRKARGDRRAEAHKPTLFLVEWHWGSRKHGRHVREGGLAAA
jgi:hypothetical protein